MRRIGTSFLVALCILLAACSPHEAAPSTDGESTPPFAATAREAFALFLSGELMAWTQEGEMVAAPPPQEPDADGLTYNHALLLLDVNGDSQEELLTMEFFGWSCYDYIGGKLYQIPYHSPGSYDHPQINGAFRYFRPGGAPTHEDYRFTVIDNLNHPTQSPMLSRYMKDGGDTWVLWLMDDREVTEAEWNAALSEWDVSEPVPTDQIRDWTAEEIAALSAAP